MDSEFLRLGVWAPTFFRHTKFEVKNFTEFFHLQSTLDSEFFIRVGSGHQLFLIMQNFRSKIFREFFHLQSAVDSEFLRLGVWVPTFFGHTKFEVKKFSEYFSFIEQFFWSH